MSQKSILTTSSSSKWKTPNEIMKLHLLKRKKKVLETRIGSKDISDISASERKTLLDCCPGGKRKNPFSKKSNYPKKQKTDSTVTVDELQEDSLFELIKEASEPRASSSFCKSDHQPKGELLKLKPFEPKQLQENKYPIEKPATTTDDELEERKSSPNLPIDWSINTRMRILCKTPLPGNNLKTSEEASGLTSFVRCLDPSGEMSPGLDLSAGAKFHQGTLYWQHPHIPWLTLFPRNSKANTGLQIAGEIERTSLANDWADGFKGLFQLLRALQCPFFYVCANAFTVLFRAAGIGGRVENHALLSPTTRGIRAALKQANIEFTQPLKRDSGLNRSNETNSSSLSNSFEDQNYPETSKLMEDVENYEDDDDDEDDEKLLENLGVEASEIKRINSVQNRKALSKEIADDFSDTSTVLIEGVDCQAFFNFLLNTKSAVANVGRLAGIPPTLLAPVAFPGATMRRLQVRTSKVRMDAVDYNSLELRGVILPHILPYLSNILKESKDAFSATMTAQMNTLAFAKASQKLINDTEKENQTSDQVFGKENLSDCGLPSRIVEAMCRVGTDAVAIMERMCYTKESSGYTWS